MVTDCGDTLIKPTLPVVFQVSFTYKGFAPFLMFFTTVVVKKSKSRHYELCETIFHLHTS